MKNYTADITFSDALNHTNTVTLKYENINKLICNNTISTRNVMYGFGLVYAFHIAELCGYEEFDILEFGVGPVPNGLLDLRSTADKIQKVANTNFKMNIIGFDRLQGMPKPSSYKDHPEIWYENLWGVDQSTIDKAPYAKIYAGELQDTIKEYTNNLSNTNSKIGFIVFDLDQYQGTKIATEILKIDAKLLFPCLPIFLDDLYTTPLMSEFTGPYLAAKEFNDENNIRKIDLKQMNLNYTTSFLQVLDHPIRTGELQPYYPLFLKHFVPY